MSPVFACPIIIHQRGRKVSREVYGYSAIPMAVVERKLGKQTTILLRKWWHLRGANGCSSATRETLCAASGDSLGVLPAQTLKQVCVAIARLVRVGALLNGGFRPSRNGITHPLRDRLVPGALVDAAPLRVPTAFPHAVLRKVLVQPGWGGRRAGAGRPKKGARDDVVGEIKWAHI